MISALLCSLLAGGTLASASLPPRYNGSTSGATFLYADQNSSPYAEISIQALHGDLVFTKTFPQRQCPCTADFGAQNFTAYYSSNNTKGEPMLQLFTGGTGEQTVYVDRDLRLRYTAPGKPVPAGANATSISTAYNEPLGGGLPSTGLLDLGGHVTQANGTRSRYNALMFCAPAGSPPGTANGPGPLSIVAYDYSINKVVPKGCISNSIFTSIDDPKVAPYDIAFRTPAEPPALYYK